MYVCTLTEEKPYFVPYVSNNSYNTYMNRNCSILDAFELSNSNFLLDS